MSNPQHRTLLAIGALLLGVLSCTLPGTASPTPFVFPTPNLTLTALFEPTVTPIAEPTGEATVTPLIAGETPEPEATEEPSPSPAPQGGARPNGPVVAAAQLELAPVLDGEFEEWPSQRYNATEVVFGSSEWSGGSDLSATYLMGWDSQNLYLAIEISDDQLVQESRGRQLFKGDSVELLLDSGLEADFLSRSLNDDDYQIGLSPGDFTGTGFEAYRWFPLAVEAPLSSVQVVSQEVATGYTLEASIPWPVFGIEPQAGDLFGFALSISDNDQHGIGVQQSMVSSVSTRVLTDPTTWGTLELVLAD